MMTWSRRIFKKLEEVVVNSNPSPLLVLVVYIFIAYYYPELLEERVNDWGIWSSLPDYHSWYLNDLLEAARAFEKHALIKSREAFFGLNSNLFRKLVESDDSGVAKKMLMKYHGNNRTVKVLL